MTKDALTWAQEIAPVGNPDHVVVIIIRGGFTNGAEVECGTTLDQPKVAQVLLSTLESMGFGISVIHQLPNSIS